MNWISVKDKLPELTINEQGEKRLPSEVVLIEDPDEDGFITGYLTIDGWREYHGTSCGCCSGKDPNPNYWMPIPKAPNVP